jgi:hypothetical protein
VLYSLKMTKYIWMVNNNTGNTEDNGMNIFRTFVQVKKKGPGKSSTKNGHQSQDFLGSPIIFFVLIVHFMNNLFQSISILIVLIQPLIAMQTIKPWFSITILLTEELTSILNIRCPNLLLSHSFSEDSSVKFLLLYNKHKYDPS